VLLLHSVLLTVDLYDQRGQHSGPDNHSDVCWHGLIRCIVVFLLLLQPLHNPSKANKYLPVTPTVGVLVVGSCSSTSTMDDGFITSEYDKSTARSTSTGGTRPVYVSTSTRSSSSEDYSSGSSRSARSQASWLPLALMVMDVLSETLMIVL